MGQIQYRERGPDLLVLLFVHLKTRMHFNKNKAISAFETKAEDSFPHQDQVSPR